jgi:hypothetical protein
VKLCAMTTLSHQIVGADEGATSQGPMSSSFCVCSLHPAAHSGKARLRQRRDDHDPDDATQPAPAGRVRAGVYRLRHGHPARMHVRAPRADVPAGTRRTYASPSTFLLLRPPAEKRRTPLGGLLHARRAELLSLWCVRMRTDTPVIRPVDVSPGGGRAAGKEAAVVPAEPPCVPSPHGTPVSLALPVLARGRTRGEKLGGRVVYLPCPPSPTQLPQPIIARNRRRRRRRSVSTQGQQKILRNKPHLEIIQSRWIWSYVQCSLRSQPPTSTRQAFAIFLYQLEVSEPHKSK